MKVKSALISVSDKTGLKEFVSELNKLGIEIISTGGTAKFIEEAGAPVNLVSDYTGFPEILNGRVKTLHPKIHGGLLAIRDNDKHMQQLKHHNIKLIDMVVVNLYPFEKTIQKEGVSIDEAIENIDIGGPSMLRSAAKNFKFVACVCNPARYGGIIEELKENNCSLDEVLLSKLATEVFEHTSRYDAAIYEFFKEKFLGLSRAGFDFPENLVLRFKKVSQLRYGENPHQMASFYKEENSAFAGLAGLKQLHGKELSFNNLIDLDAAWNLSNEFDEPAASIIKHTNPCGCATSSTLAQAYKDALSCDPLSAFGSVVGLNRVIDLKTAKAIAGADFVECIIAPGLDDEALAILKKKKNLRIIIVPVLDKKLLTEKDYKRITGGLLIQDKDLKEIDPNQLKVVTKTKPARREKNSLLFAWKVAKHVKSNAIVIAKGTKTVGIGAGQMSRVDSVIIAIRKAGKLAKGASLASDAFFPKEDSIKFAKNGGIVSIIQPGGSIRDNEVIAACNKAGISMVFAGLRHFKH